MSAQEFFALFLDKVKKVRPSVPCMALATYVLLLLSRLLDTSLLDRSNEYLNVVLLQILIFILPAAIFYRIRGNNYVKKLKLRAFHPKCIVLIAACVGALVCGSILIEGVLGATSSSTSFSLYDTFISKNDGSAGNVIYLILAYAALPAFSEEIIFRGIVCSEYENKGFFCCAAVSSFMFAILHFNIAKFPVYLFAGFVLSWVLYISRSLFCTVIVHFFYNIAGIFIIPYISAFYSTTGAAELFTFIVIALFLIFSVIFCSVTASIYKSLAKTAATPEFSTELRLRDSALDAAAVILSPVSLFSIVLFILTAVFTN